MPSCRHRRLGLVLIVGCCAGLFCLALLSPATGQLGGYFPFLPRSLQTTTETDPVPIRRVQVPPERVLLELERARQDTLVQLSREEFEARVRKASEAGIALKQPPRLLEARYRATLDDMALAGTAQWTILNPTTLAGILPVRPFNLALRSARLDKADAILGDLEGKTLGLLVEQPGKHLLTLDWTSRGEAGPAGLRFRLEVLPCTLTTFELELPADQEPVAVQDRSACLLSGPQSLAAGKGRLWRLDCPESAPIDLLIRPAGGAGQPAPLILSSLQTRQVLTPDRLEADFNFNLQVLHGSVRELVCECDPALHPVSVSVRNLEIETWELRPGAAQGSLSTLHIRLPEPFQGRAPSLRVHCLARVAAGEPWTSPGLHLSGAVPRGELLSLRIAPGIELSNWRAGYFELRRTASGDDGGQVLTLQSGLRDPEATHRPGAVIKLQEAETKVRESIWWQVRPDGSALTAQLTYDVIRGQLFRLPLDLPPGWQIDKVELSPVGEMRNWMVVPSSKGHATLVVDLQNPVRASGSVKLTIDMRPQPGAMPPGTDKNGAALPSIQPFPIVAPRNVPLWEGSLAISVDPSYQATVKASVPASLPPYPRESASAGLADLAPLFSPLPSPSAPFSPGSSQPPDYFYSFRGQAVTGTLQLGRRAARLLARCNSEVILAPGRATLQTRLLLEPSTGSVDTIDLAVSAPVGDKWQWKTESTSNGVRAPERLHAVETAPRLSVLGAGSALEAASLFALPRAGGSAWRLTLARPLREPLTLETTIDLSGAAKGNATQRWEVPLVTVLTADRMAGEVRVHLAGADHVEVDAQGLREIAAGANDRAPSPWRLFRYGHEPVALSLRGQVPTVERSSVAQAGEVHLTTYLEPNARLRNHFRFRVSNWPQKTLPLRLPSGARVLTAALDGRWIAQPQIAGLPGGEVVVYLPVAGGGTTHAFETVYATEAPPVRLWCRLQSPMPVLPLPVDTFRRTWCFPAGITPLDDGRLQRLPGSGASGEESSIWTREANTLIPDWALPGLGAEEWRVRQQRLAAEANARFRRAQRDPKDDVLGEILDDLVFDHFKGQEAVVVDVLALEEAGLQPFTLMRREPSVTVPEVRLRSNSRQLHLNLLDGLGIVCLACRSGPLLTTQQKWESWQRAEGRHSQLAEVVEEAVAQAARHGQDSSGRFCRGVDWLVRHGANRANSVDTNQAFAALSARRLPQQAIWSTWEPLAGIPSEDSVVVFRPAALSGVSWVITAVVLIAAWRVRRMHARTRLGLMLLWLGGGAIALLWLPVTLRGLVWLPLLPGIAVAAFWYLWSALRPSVRLGSPKPVAAASTLLALAITACLPGQAAAPGPHIVLVLPGPAEALNKQTVLAPQELLDQLRTLARRGASGLQGTILVGAGYDGAVTDGAVEFKAEFKVHSFSEGPSSLAFPLGGIELREATLDGTDAYPVAQAPPLSGYTLQVNGRGPHKVQIRFAVPTTGAGAEHELHFTIPELAQTHLRLVAPPGSKHLQAVYGRGAQRITSASKGAVLEADLGRLNTLQIRWRQEKTPPPTDSLQVHEIYLWELRSSASMLRGVLQYTTTQGAPTTLSIALPENMEVSQVRCGPGRDTAAVPRLKKWLVSGTKNERLLRLEFQTPIANSVQVFVELVSSLPLGPNVSLALPTPLNAGPAPLDCFLGYRVEGRQAEPIQFTRITGIQPDEFNLLWQGAETDDRAAAVQRAYSFRRTPAGGPILRLRLQPPGARLGCLQNLTWHVSRDRAFLQSTARLSSPKEEISLVEWEVPAHVVVASVQGADVRAWSRHGSRIQIWLRRSVEKTTLELSGWIQPPAGKMTDVFTLPCLQVIGAQTQWTMIRTIADDGLALKSRELQNLWQLPTFRPSARDRTYLAKGGTYGGSFQLNSAAANAGVSILTLAEIHGNVLAFASTIDYHLRDGELQTLTLRIRNWEGAQVRLEAPYVSARHERQLDAAVRLWTLDLKPGVSGRYQVKLSGSLPLESTSEVLMPDVQVEGVPEAERFLATSGSNLVVEEPRGLVAVTDTARALKSWPAVDEQLKRAGGSVWKVAREDWKLRLQPRFPGANVKPVRIFLEEQAAAIRDGQRWEHQATYWLYHEAGTDLGIVLPAGARLLRATLDGAEAMTLQVDAQHFWLPLTSGSGTHALRLYWTFEGSQQAPDQPDLRKPRLEDALHAPVPPAGNVAPGVEQVPGTAAQKATSAGNPAALLWSVQIPPGFHLTDIVGNAMAASAASQDLRRAAALLNLSGELADRAAEKIDSPLARQLELAQEHFYRQCRSAQYHLALPGPARDSPALASWLAALQEANSQLAESRQFEPVRALAEKNATRPFASAKPPGQEAKESLSWVEFDDFCCDHGIPTYWRAVDPNLGPRLHLVPVHVQESSRAAALSGLFLVICFSAWFLTYSPRLVGIVQTLWPEEIAVLAIVGWQAVGAHLGFVLLIFLAIAGRIYCLARWVFGILPGVPETASSRPGSVSGPT